jgi:membrane-bound lytic murein transglycosylase
MRIELEHIYLNIVIHQYAHDNNNNYKKKRNKIIKEKNSNGNYEVSNEYEINLDDYDSEENDSKASSDFTSMFTKFFDQGQLQKQEKEIVENMEKLSIQPEF